MCYASRFFFQIAPLAVLNTHTEFDHRIFRGDGDIRCFTRYVTAEVRFASARAMRSANKFIRKRIDFRYAGHMNFPGGNRRRRCCCSVYT